MRKRAGVGGRVVTRRSREETPLSTRLREKGQSERKKDHFSALAGDGGGQVGGLLLKDVKLAWRGGEGGSG